MALPGLKFDQNTSHKHYQSMINQYFDFITLFHRIFQLFLSQKQRAKSPPFSPYEVEINKYDSGRFSALCLTCNATRKSSPKSCLNGYNFITFYLLVYYVIPKKNEISAQSEHWLRFQKQKQKRLHFLPCQIPSFLTPVCAHKLRDFDMKTTIWNLSKKRVFTEEE